MTGDPAGREVARIGVKGAVVGPDWACGVATTASIPAMNVPGRPAPAGLVMAPLEIGADAAVLRPCGEIDASTAPALRAAVEAGAATGLPLLVIDLSGVTFLESAGLAVLIGAHRDMPPGQRVALAAVPPRMRRMLQVAAVDQIMLVHNGGDPWPWPSVAPPK